MLGLKNPFTKSDPPTNPPVPSEPVSVDAAETAKKRWQLEQGRTKARVESLTAELDASQRAVDHARRILGERRVEGVDTAAATESLRQAEGQLREDQEALVVARQKDAEAQRALTDATRQTSIAADDEVVTAFKAAALKMETLLCGEMKLAADELGATLTAVKARSGSDGGVVSSLKDFLLWFPVYRDRACAELIPSGRTYSQVLDEKKKTFSQWADDVKYSMSRRTGR